MIGAAVCTAALIALFIFSVNNRSKDTAFSRNIFAMDTIMELAVYGVDADTATIALDEAESLINELDHELSAHDKESSIYKLNEAGEGILSGYARECFMLAYSYSADEELPFNMLILPLMEIWGFGDDSNEFIKDRVIPVPTEDEIEAALAYEDIDDIELSDEEGDSLYVRFKKEGMAVDLGGIAKGYASSLVMDLFREHGIKSALINLGGNVVTLGSKTDGTPFRVGIRDPEGGYFDVVCVSDMAVVTSGGYERYVTGEDGKVYHHIIDPLTGRPAESGLISATAVCTDPTLADVLSTSLFIMGREGAEKYASQHIGELEILLLCDDGESLHL